MRRNPNFQDSFERAIANSEAPNIEGLTTFLDPFSTLIETFALNQPELGLEYTPIIDTVTKFQGLELKFLIPQGYGSIVWFGRDLVMALRRESLPLLNDRFMPDDANLHNSPTVGAVYQQVVAGNRNRVTFPGEYRTTNLHYLSLLESARRVLRNVRASNDLTITDTGTHPTLDKAQLVWDIAFANSIPTLDPISPNTEPMNAVPMALLSEVLPKWYLTRIEQGTLTQQEALRAYFDCCAFLVQDTPRILELNEANQYYISHSIGIGRNSFRTPEIIVGQFTDAIPPVIPQESWNL